MGYCATGSGSFLLKPDMDENKYQEILALADDIFSSVEDYGNHEINVTVDGNYYDDEIYSFFDAIEGYTTDGYLRYSGDEDAHWQFYFDGKEFIEENGKIVFPSDYKDKIIMRIENSDLSEFVGQIIDIFEDYLGEKNVQIVNPERDFSNDPPDERAIIYGTDYGAIEDSLRNLIGRWSGAEIAEVVS